MGAKPTENETTPGKLNFITLSIMGVAVIIAWIWFIAHAPTKTSPQDAVVPANETVTIYSGLSQEQIERQHVAEEQHAEPVIRMNGTNQPAVAPSKDENDAVVLQKAKAKVDERIVERMQEYIRNNPNRDTRNVKEQIKRRENKWNKIR